MIVRGVREEPNNEREEGERIVRIGSVDFVRFTYSGSIQFMNSDVSRIELYDF